MVASERPVIQTSLDLEAEEIHELKPGEALIMSKDGKFRTEQILTPKNLAACSFERVYFSRGSDKDIYQERKALGRTLVAPILKAVDGELDQTVFSYIPNTAEAAYYGLLEGFDNFLNKQKMEAIAALGTNPDIKTVAKILDRRIRSEKIAWKDIKMRTFIAEGNSRNDLAAHVYDITYGSVEAGKDNLVVIDDSIVRGTTPPREHHQNPRPPTPEAHRCCQLVAASKDSRTTTASTCRTWMNSSPLRQPLRSPWNKAGKQD